MSENKFPFTPAETDLLMNAAHKGQTVGDIQNVFADVMNTLIRGHKANALPTYSTGMSSACSTVVILDTNKNLWKTAFNNAMSGLDLPKVAYDLLNAHAALLDEKGVDAYQDWLKNRPQHQTAQLATAIYRGLNV